MSYNRFSGRAKTEGDKFATLRAWVKWVLKNPVDEHQEAHAMATNDLFALVGSREAELAKRKERDEKLLKLVRGANNEIVADLKDETNCSCGHDDEYSRKTCCRHEALGLLAGALKILEGVGA